MGNKLIRLGCILPPCLFNLYAERLIKKTGLDLDEIGVKIAGKNIHNLRCADNTTLPAEHIRT